MRAERVTVSGEAGRKRIRKVAVKGLEGVCVCRRVEGREGGFQGTKMPRVGGRVGKRKAADPVQSLVAAPDLGENYPRRGKPAVVARPQRSLLVLGGLEQGMYRPGAL